MDLTGLENPEVKRRNKNIVESSHLKHILSSSGARSYWGLSGAETQVNLDGLIDADR